MSDSHEGHNHSIVSFENINRAFYIGIGLNTLYTIIEFYLGYTTNSLALIADASHNLSDVASLIISLIGMRLAKAAETNLYTYGYKKASILASLVNSILLIIIVFKIITEGIERLNAPYEVQGTVIIFTALIGVFINTISAYLFYKGQKQDVNIKGAFLHLMVDAIVSFGVVISGIIIHYTNWTVIDPIISFIIAIVILFSTWSLLKESIKLTLDGVPMSVDMIRVRQILLENKYIEEIHHVHVWALSSSENAMTVHVMLKRYTDLTEFIEEKKSIKHDLLHENIKHVTIEVDSYSEE